MAEPDDDDVPGVPEWVVTYGDMMSLLLTFFIMLVSMSEMKSDSGATRSALDAISQSFGRTQGTSGAPGPSMQTSSDHGQLGSTGSRSEGGAEKAGHGSKGASGAHKELQRISDGTMITLGGPVRFDRFDTHPTPEIKKNLDIIADVLRSKPNRIVVRGHASPEPIPSNDQIAAAAFGASNPLPKAFAGNGLLFIDGLDVHDQVDLSFARARAVAEYLISRGIPRERIQVSAAGDTEPRLRTPHASQQALNRRVDVFLVDSYITPPKPHAGR